MICKICRKDFTKEHFNQKLCSIECKKESRKIVLKTHKQTDKWKESNAKWVASDRRKENEKIYKKAPTAKKLMSRKSVLWKQTRLGKYADWFSSESKKGCKMCKSKENLCLDHVIPMSKGGEDDVDNFQILCIGCNSRKGDRLWQN